MKTTPTRAGLAAAVIAAGALAASATSASNSASLPAAPPSDAGAASLRIHTTTVPNTRLGATPGATRTTIYRIGRNGPRVRVGALREPQLGTGFQTLTVFPPAGRTIFQGFAVISGGNAGSVQILNTRSTNGRYIVNLAFPGEQGIVGKLTLRVQSLPRNP